MEAWYIPIILRENDRRLEVLLSRSPVPGPSLFHSLGAFCGPCQNPQEKFQKWLSQTHGRVPPFSPVPLNQRTYKNLTFTPLLIWWGAFKSSSHYHWIEIESLQSLPEPIGAVFCETLAKFWPLLPYSHGPLTSFCTLHPELKEASHLTFYGGTFAPLHEGHFSCLKLCPVRPLIVVPDHNPQKPSKHSFWNLYKELKRKIRDEGIYVYPGFCGQERPNPTIDWLKQISVSKSLLLGDDCFINLPQWQSSQQILQILKGLYVVPRFLKTKEFQSHLKKLLSSHPHLKVELLSHHHHESLSSTHLRERNSKQKKVDG